MREEPKAIRATVMEFATIVTAESSAMTPVTDKTIWLRMRAQVLNEDGETVEYLSDAQPFHRVVKA